MDASLAQAAEAHMLSGDLETLDTGPSSLALLDIAGVPCAIIDSESTDVSRNSLFKEIATIDGNTLRCLDNDNTTALPTLTEGKRHNRESQPLKCILSGTLITYEVTINRLDRGKKAVILKELQATESEASLYLKITELQSAKEDLEQLAFAACHDLRSPLRAMATIPSWISNDIQQSFGYLPPSIGEHTEWLKRQALRLNAMLDDLLVYATVESSKVESVAKSINLGELALQVWKALPNSENYSLTLNVELEYVVLPEQELTLILKHLLRNAITHHDKNPGRVCFETHCGEGFLNLAVRDDGPGIATQYHEEALSLFCTLKSRDKTEGSGMGLPITRKVVKSMKGQLALEEGLDGMGTSIVMKLPYLNLDSQQPANGQ